MTNRKIPLIARIVQITVILGCIGGLLWVGMRFFEPVSVPPSVKIQRAVKFDASSDVTKNSVFSGLQQYGPVTVEVGETGRVNPFVPLPSPVKATSTATSTDSTL
jgi:hypothetical protein